MELDTLYLRGRRQLEERNYRAAVGILLPYADRNTAIALLSLGEDERALDVLYGLPENGRTLYLRAIALARLEEKTKPSKSSPGHALSTRIWNTGQGSIPS